MEEVKQKISAIEGRLKRYRERTKQYKQNRTFQNNEKKFYEQINESKTNTSEPPNSTEAEKFWTDIWKRKEHNKKSKWISDIKNELMEIEEGPVASVHIITLKSVLKKVTNWKTPGHDGIHGFWFKTFTSIHKRMAQQLNRCLQETEVPDWMTKGITTLIQKDPQKGNIPSNYRPITCLPMMWKILTAVIKEEIYASLNWRKLFTEEQKGCRKGKRGTYDLLYIDQHILKEVKIDGKILQWQGSTTEKLMTWSHLLGF